MLWLQPTSYTGCGQHHTQAEVYRMAAAVEIGAAVAVANVCIHMLLLLLKLLLLLELSKRQVFSSLEKPLALVFAPCNPSCFIAGHFLLSLHLAPCCRSHEQPRYLPDPIFVLMIIWSFLKFDLAKWKAAACELETKAMKVVRYDMCKYVQPTYDRDFILVESLRMIGFLNIV